jgi:hypothetical protein
MLLGEGRPLHNITVVHAGQARGATIIDVFSSKTELQQAVRQQRGFAQAILRGLWL